jgi:DNA topoisomerase-1
MSEPMQAYCVKCKEKREMVNPHAIYTKSGTPATQGACVVCGTTLTRMGLTADHATVPKPEIVAKPAAAKKGAAKKTATKQKTAAKKTTAKKSAKKADSSAKRSKSGRLVIVESPAKARSVGSFLGKGYTVIASKGHVRDLLATQLSVDVTNDFEPKYRVPNEKRATVKEIKAAVESAKEIYLATDPDREGEAIAWHLMAAAEIPPTAKRVVFHEITDSAVAHAFEQPRDINLSLVNAQQARRILDRLVGYGLSPLLWEKVQNYLSAGRVQSIALRMVVEREREIEQFVPVEYWTIDAELNQQIPPRDRFVARLVKINGAEAELNSEGAVRPHLDILERSFYQVSEVKTGTRQRKPSPPFTTSTLQQEASRRLGFSASRTMQIAQRLYEGIDLGEGKISGLITYMRTDSVNVSAEAQQEARHYITTKFSAQHVPAEPPKYKTKAKGAQEAHEAIRPTSVLRVPNAALKAQLEKSGQEKANDLLKLYKLIWERFVASQMANALYDTLRVEVKAGLSADDMPYLLRASGSRIAFAGFLALYEDAKDEDAADTNGDEGRIPLSAHLAIGEALDLTKLLPEQHFTQAPPRYTEASLVRTLEEYGIGRPSTYAPIVGVIQDREYVSKRPDKRLAPTDTGKTVSDLLVQFFPSEMDYQFTARMEEQLDTIADGEAEWKGMLREFYAPFEQRLQHAREHMPLVKKPQLVGRACPECGGDLIIKSGRNGKFIGCANYPTCTHTEPYIEYVGMACPLCGTTEGGQVVARRSRKGRTFYGCSRYPACEYSTWKLPKNGTQNDASDEAPADEPLQDFAS